MTASTTIAYQPQTDRLGLLHRGISTALLLILLVFTSVYVSEIDPKTSVLLLAFCVLIGGRRLITPAVWPLVAIVAYGTAIAFIFPGPKPEAGLLLEHPLYLLDCVFLAALCLGGQSVGRQYTLLLGILIVSLIGAVGDASGHDMTAMLPFQMPDDDFSTILQLQQSGDVVRIRGFFTEAGVLAAVSIGIATIVALGAVVLIICRSSVKVAWIGLIGAVGAGAAIICITVTKSGFIMVVAGLVGFCAVLLVSRNPRCRFISVAGLCALIVGGALFLVAGPPTLTGYIRGEFVAAVNPYDMSHDVAGGHYGTITRYKCWHIALTSLADFPFGVGPYGLGSVIQNAGNAGMTREMRYFFSRDVFGLKNALANLMAQEGIVGIGLLLFWTWIAFLKPIRAYLVDGSVRNALIAGLYGASALSSFIFLFSCELYPSVAFLILLKFHADAVAQTCAVDSEAGVESIELIG